MNGEYFLKLKSWLKNQNANSKWCLLLNADPDALGSAQAMRKLLGKYVASVDIRRINEVTRPDNLAMLRYLRIKTSMWVTAWILN